MPISPGGTFPIQRLLCPPSPPFLTDPRAMCVARLTHPVLPPTPPASHACCTQVYARAQAASDSVRRTVAEAAAHVRGSELDPGSTAAPVTCSSPSAAAGGGGALAGDAVKTDCAASSTAAGNGRVVGEPEELGEAAGAAGAWEAAGATAATAAAANSDSASGGEAAAATAGAGGAAGAQAGSQAGDSQGGRATALEDSQQAGVARVNTLPLPTVPGQSALMPRGQSGKSGASSAAPPSHQSVPGEEAAAAVAPPPSAVPGDATTVVVSPEPTPSPAQQALGRAAQQSYLASMVQAAPRIASQLTGTSNQPGSTQLTLLAGDDTGAGAAAHGSGGPELVPLPSLDAVLRDEGKYAPGGTLQRS